MYTQILLLSGALLAAALPQQTTAPPSTTTPPPSAITTAPGLTCTSGSTVLFTSDCTFGIPTSYCYSEPPVTQCPSGYYPGVYHPGHCETAQTCYPVDAPWITTECPSNGETAYTTSTLYQGTLAGGQSTIISQVECACATDLYYSWSYGPSTEQFFCMPKTDCPAGMTTSISTNSYCATAPPESCTGVPLTTDFCACETGTPVYSSGGATPTGCA